MLYVNEVHSLLRIKGINNNVNARNSTLVATQPWMYHVLALVSDSKLIIYYIVKSLAMDDYSLVQQSPVVSTVAKLVPNIKRRFKTRKGWVMNRNW